MHHLLSLFADSPKEGTPELLSESIKQSILIVIADIGLARQSRTNPDTIRDRTAFTWSNANRLRNALQHLNQSKNNWQDQHEDVLVWMACLGVQQTALSAVNKRPTQTPPPSDEENTPREWFVSFHRGQRQKSARFVTPDELVQIMSRYVHRFGPSGQSSSGGLEELLAHSQYHITVLIWESIKR